MTATVTPLKAFLGRAWKQNLIIQSRRMSGARVKDDWRGVDHVQVQVFHKAQFRALAYEHDLKVWDMPEHWLGVMEGGSVALLKAVLNALYDAYPTWQQGEIGMQIAYFTLAVVNHSTLPVDRSVPWSADFLETSRRLFPPQHPVWPFISLSDHQHGNSPTH